MTDTVISSATREVVLGLERPFVMIGERINPTGRKILAAEMAAGNFSRVEADALAQVAAGAHMLDVNAGIPLADEPAILARAVQLVQSITDLPLSIDSSIVKALEAGLAVYRGKPLVNSVTGEEERLEAVLPLVKKYGAAVVAISNDETGISEDPDVRFEVARKIVQRAADHGIPASDIVVDPLVMPIGAINQAGVQVMHLLRRLKNELRVNTTCGASNVSFGLPAREGISATFLTMAIGAGLTSAIMNPMHLEIVKACMAADVMMGHDPDCAPSGVAAAAAPEACSAGASRKRRIQRAQSGSWPIMTSAAMHALTISRCIGFMIAEVSPAPIAMVRKVALMPSRAGRPKLTLDAPQVVFTRSSFLRRRSRCMTCTPAWLMAPIGMTSGSTTMSLAGMP